jgi:hypothetical protein
MIAAEPTDLLRQTVPDWFNVTRSVSGIIEGHALIVVVNGVGRTVADLRITSPAGSVSVSEAVLGNVFPSRCSERHIQWDGSFCIGYRAGINIVTVDEAVVWWGLLEQFLRLQRVASRTRLWPVRQAIAHGDAGHHHLSALEAARELGLEEDYFEMLEVEPKWFSGRFPKLNKESDRLLNGRLPCPTGCMRKEKPILRRDCTKTEVVCRLLHQERLRRKKEQEFWESQRLAGVKCCGTIDNCPLA